MHNTDTDTDTRTHTIPYPAHPIHHPSSRSRLPSPIVSKYPKIPHYFFDFHRAFFVDLVSGFFGLSSAPSKFSPSSSFFSVSSSWPAFAPSNDVVGQRADSAAAASCVLRLTRPRTPTFLWCLFRVNFRPPRLDRLPFGCPAACCCR